MNHNSTMMAEAAPAATGSVDARLKEEARSYLLVGGSGTGKSTFLARLARAHPNKPLFLVGGDPSDYKDLSCVPRELDSSLTQVEHCVVLLDDLFSIKKTSDSENLRSLLCKTKRHNKVNVGVGIHTLEFTGVRGGILDHFDIVVFTKTKQSDDRNSQLFLKRIGGPNEWLSEEHFSSIPDFGYLWIDLHNQESLLINSDGTWADGCGGTHTDPKARFTARKEALARRRETLRKDITKILKVFPDVHTLAVCHLDYILRNLPADQISTTDFTFTLKSSATGTEKKESTTAQVSLLDFLVTCQKPEKKPSKGQKRLKKYLDSIFHTPQALILNKMLQ